MGQMKIEWSGLARVRLREIFDYYHTIVGFTIANKIIGKIIKCSRLLIHHPQLGSRLFPKGEFRYLVEGNYRIIYWINSGKIMIATIFDTRQDPEKLQKEISDIQF